MLFLSGKGGVGKTTVAAAVALTAARAGRHTLLISTDPAHNLGDLFGVQLASAGIRNVLPSLDALEVDPDSESRRYLKSVKKNMRRLVRSTMIDEAERQIDLARNAPGATEAALLERVVAILLEQRCAYDQIVFDTAPTGHTMHLLTLPNMMTIWTNGLLRFRAQRIRDHARLSGDVTAAEDPVFNVLRQRHDRLAKAQKLLADSETTGFVFVLIPEAWPIAETRRGIDAVASLGLSVSALVVNQLLPEWVTEPFFCRRLQRQQVYLDRIDGEFANYPQIRLPLLDRDVDSPAALEQLLSHFT